MTIFLQDEMTELRRELLEMGEAAERQVRAAFDALAAADRSGTKQVRKGDLEINELEVGVEARCFRILALASPVGSDLRSVLASLRISTIFERIGDLAKGMAKKTRYLIKQGDYIIPDAIEPMGLETMALLRKAVDALAHERMSSLDQARQADERIDDYEKVVFRWVEETAPHSSEATAMAVDFYSIARRLERIADLSINIIEEVNFLVEGRIVRHGIEVQPGEMPGDE